MSKPAVEETQPSHAYGVNYSFGYAERDITPPLSTPYLSHIPRHGEFTSVGDRLHARACAISTGATMVVIIAVDLIGLGRGVIDGASLSTTVRSRVALETGVPFECVLICATHAHSTPETSGITHLPRSARPWLSDLISHMVAAAIDAIANSSPCQLRVGSALVPGESSVRRYRHQDSLDCSDPIPTGIADNSVVVLVADAMPAGLHVLFNYACHPVLLQAQPTMSADFPGAAIAALDTSNVKAMFLQGACGDINPSAGDYGSYQDMQRQGRHIALGVQQATRRAQAGRSLTGLIRVFTELVPLAKRPPPRSLGWAAQHRDDPDPKTRRRAQDVIDLAEKLGDDSLPFMGEVQVFRIGSVAFVALPGEPFSELGQLIKAMSPASYTFVIGYANDYLGYLAPRWAWLDAGYEIDDGPWSMVSGSAAEALVEAAIRMLDDLWQEDDTLDHIRSA